MRFPFIHGRQDTIYEKVKNHTKLQMGEQKNNSQQELYTKKKKAV